MAQPLNTKVDLVIDAMAFTGLTDYGQIVIGDRGFEPYHAKDPRKFIQIPREKIDYVLTSVMFKRKWTPRYAIQAEENGVYMFVSKEPKRVLQAIRGYVDPDHMVQSLSFFDVIKGGILSVGEKKKQFTTVTFL